MKTPGCGADLAPGQWFTFCGETDMGQSLPALCIECGGSFKRAIGSEELEKARRAADRIAQAARACGMPTWRLFEEIQSLIPEEDRKRIAEALDPKQSEEYRIRVLGEFPHGSV